VKLEEALYAHLSSSPQATAELVGTRIYPLLIPQDVAVPALAYQRVGTQLKLEHGGRSGWARAVLQITVQARTYDSAKTVAAALRADLSGYRDTMGGVGGVEVHFCNQIGETDTEQLFDAAVTRCDFEFLYKE